MPAPSRTLTTDTGSPAESESTPSAETGAPGTLPAGAGTEMPRETSVLAGMLMAGGVLIITFILMSKLRRKQRSKPAPMSTAEQIAQLRARATDSAGIDAFKADAHDFTRQMAALLDSKAERLEQVIADADDRLARLERAERGTVITDPPHETGRPAATIRRTPPDLDRSPPGDPLHDRVYRLADSGLDPVAIAREIGQPTGQIELILALRG